MQFVNTMGTWYSAFKFDVACQEDINQTISVYISNKKHLNLINRAKKAQNEAIMITCTNKNVLCGWWTGQNS